MKREILLSLGILFCINGFAQNIKIEGRKIMEASDTVFVSFTVVAEKIKSNDRLTLTPVMYSGDKSKSFKPIIITGRNRAITDKRQSVSAGIRTIAHQRIPYSTTVPYEGWMSDVSLRIDSKIESCCTEHMLVSQTVVQDQPIRYDVVLPKIELIKPYPSPIKEIDVKLPFLAPMKEYSAVKENFDVMRADGALIVRFRQGRNMIDLNYDDNAKSLQEMCKVLELIDSDPNASVGKILLAGSASPEGSTKVNDRLSRERAQTLQTYLTDQTSIDTNLVESITIGEDWIGLGKMVEQSDMQYKEEVLEIINNVPVMRGREKQLMDLKWGRPYNYMMEHFFPKLRNAGYIRIFYETKPDVEFENTNQAIELYNKNAYRDALTRLEGVKATATTENICGVCHMMLGEYDKAEIALNNAVKLGNTQAADQLKQLEKLKAIEQ